MVVASTSPDSLCILHVHHAATSIMLRSSLFLGVFNTLVWSGYEKHDAWSLHATSLFLEALPVVA